METNHLIIIGDSRNMKELRTESIDLVITSPPYWNLKNYGKGDVEKGYAQYIEEIGSVLKEVSRVLKRGRFACINVGTAVSDFEMKHIPSDVIGINRRLGFIFKKEIIWVKPKGTQGLWQRGTTKFLKKEPYPFHLNLNIMHEYILIFQKEGSPDLQFSEKDRLPEDFIKEVCWSVWEMKVSLTKGHPAPFPEELPSRLMKLYSREGEKVLDPFGGSGTVMKVATDLNRSSVIYEINAKYLDLIKRKVGFQQGSLAGNPIFKLIIRDEKNA
jgi:DNA modification methylase